MKFYEILKDNGDSVYIDLLKVITMEKTDKVTMRLTTIDGKVYDCTFESVMAALAHAETSVMSLAKD